MTGILGSVLWADVLPGEAALLPVTHVRTAIDYVGINETNTRSKAVLRSGSDTITFVEKYFGEPHFVDGSDTITFTETRARTVYQPRGNSDTLTIAESYGSANVFYRSGADTLSIVEGGFKNVGGVDVFVPGYVHTILPASGIRYTVLEGVSRSVVLPNPLFGDTEANGDALSVFRTQTNRRVVTVKRQDARTLAYQFAVTRQKAIELREFIRTEIDNRITLRNWKGEIWYGNIINNPFTLTATGRWGPCTERVEVELELKAVRTH